MQEGSQQERGNDVDLPGAFKTISCGYRTVKNPTGVIGQGVNVLELAEFVGKLPNFGEGRKISSEILCAYGIGDVSRLCWVTPDDDESIFRAGVV